MTAPEVQITPESQRRFYLRTLWSILLPFAFAAYYLWTYIVWLRPSSNPAADIDNPIPNGRYVWWSWFVIGAIGINISNYALAGTEAGMMMSDAFKPKTAAYIRAHRDKPWSTTRGGSSSSRKFPALSEATDDLTVCGSCYFS